jgi:NAD(P)-dependent dehydrogenase (short-subunit alcohol dehydrogenase family)
VVVADVQDEAGQAVAAEVGGKYVHLDVADPAAWGGQLDGVDLVHLNAGVVTGQGQLVDVTDEQFRRIMGVNVDGVVFGAREAARAMAERGGAVVATASLAGVLAFGPDPLYTLTKHAVVGLVRALGRSLEPQGITVNAVCPGIVETPLVSADGASRLREAGIALIDPDEVAAAVLAAATSGRTGECWTVIAGADPAPHAFAPVDFAPTRPAST